MIMKLPKHALSLLLAIPLIISTACGDDDFSGGGGGKKKTDRNDPTKSVIGHVQKKTWMKIIVQILN